MRHSIQTNNQNLDELGIGPRTSSNCIAPRERLMRKRNHAPRPYALSRDSNIDLTDHVLSSNRILLRFCCLVESFHVLPIYIKAWRRVQPMRNEARRQPPHIKRLKISLCQRHHIHNHTTWAGFGALIPSPPRRMHTANSIPLSASSSTKNHHTNIALHLRNPRHQTHHQTHTARNSA